MGRPAIFVNGKGQCARPPASDRLLGIRSRSRSVELPMWCNLQASSVPLSAAGVKNGLARTRLGPRRRGAPCHRGPRNYFSIQPPIDVRASAAADARQALALEPDHVDAHLQLAIALGQLAELKNPISAHVGGYTEEGKALLDQALLLDPDNEWAQALLGMWHLRVVHHAGAALAGQLYGASRETGVGLCLQAIGGARSALALKYGCAAVLVELDFDQFEDTAERTLAAVKDAAARDAAENLVQAEATRLLDELKSGAFERSRRDARESELVP